MIDLRTYQKIKIINPAVTQKVHLNFSCNFEIIFWEKGMSDKNGGLHE